MADYVRREKGTRLKSNTGREEKKKKEKSPLRRNKPIVSGPRVIILLGAGKGEVGGGRGAKASLVADGGPGGSSPLSPTGLQRREQL